MLQHYFSRKCLSCVALILLICVLSCKTEKNTKVLATKPLKNWVNWNVLFDPKTANDSVTKKARLQELRTYVERRIAVYNDSSKHKLRFSGFRTPNCPCDPALNALEIDVDWDQTDTSGSDTRVQPTPPPPPVVTGGTVEENAQMSGPTLERNELAGRTIMKLPAKNKYAGPLLAIIDTGIDTAAFSGNVNSTIWQSPSGQTLTNFVYPGSFGGFKDDHPNRHGTQVASLILQQFLQNEAYPQVMVLKAMDSLGSGSSFSVTCALSYAIQNKASLINMSFGYYGQSHRILKQYIQRASRDSITMVCAAGNIDGVRTDLCSTTPNTGHELTSSRLFYPACYSTDFPENVVTVAGLNTRLGPCYYQNYSNRYVTIGVMNTKSCCFFNSLVDQFGVEGSSYAAPVASGRIGALKVGEPARRTGLFYVGSLIMSRVPAITTSERAITGKYVHNGDFIIY